MRRSVQDSPSNGSKTSAPSQRRRSKRRAAFFGENRNFADALVLDRERLVEMFFEEFIALADELGTLSKREQAELQADVLDASNQAADLFIAKSNALVPTLNIYAIECATAVILRPNPRTGFKYGDLDDYTELREAFKRGTKIASAQLSDAILPQRVGGRPVARSPQEKAALIAALQAALPDATAKVVKRDGWPLKNQEQVYKELARASWGPESEYLSHHQIKRLLGEAGRVRETEKASRN